jgi:oligopeptide/dipeptide ABC transporter ATP-binding protein
LQRPRHPYTRALLDALPHPETGNERELVAIAGAPPTPGAFPSGCTFHPRCGYLRESCRTDVPELVDIGGRVLACPVDPFAEAR